MKSGSFLFRLLVASVWGTAIGSAMLAVFLTIALIVTEGFAMKAVGGLALFPFALVVGIVPVLAVTSIVGPVCVRLARVNDRVSAARYFAAMSVIIALPWMLAPDEGWIGAAGMLLSYGYPTAYIYLRLIPNEGRGRGKPGQG